MAQDNEDVVEKGEVRGKLLGLDELPDWGNDARIVESRDEPEEEVEDEPEEEGVTEIEEPVVVNTVPDPGNYEPKDYSFDVTVYDADGNKPKNVTVKSVEQWDELLDTDPNFGNATSLMKAQRLATKMESNLERDKADFDKQKADFDTASQDVTRRAEATQTMVNEIAYLVGRKDLPEVDPKYANADWSDPNVAKQPGIKEQIELLTFMRNENQTREKAGLKPITSVLDAFNAFQIDRNRKGEADRQERTIKARKEAGAKVAGTQPNASTQAPKGIMVGRGGNLRDIGNSTNWQV